MNNQQIYQLLEGVTPAFFGLGFIQCKLNDKQRIHFYHPELVPTVNVEEEIHNHRYDFTSTILRGAIRNKKYHFLPGVGNSHYLQQESCNEHVKVDNKNSTFGSIELYEDTLITQGQSYFMPHEVFHTVSAHKCVTFLERTPYKKELAQVVRPVNGEVICPFAKKMSVEECWEIIKDCLN